MDDSPHSLPPEPDPPGSSGASGPSGTSGRATWAWIGTVGILLLAAVILGGTLYKAPYVALLPGNARDTEDLVQVSGLDRYPSQGQLLFTTVKVRQRPNLWEYLWLHIDHDADIVPERVVLEGRSPEENRQLNVQQMTDSKSVAIAVALKELGYNSITSNGVLINRVVDGSPAQGQLRPGDTLVAIDGQPVTGTQDLSRVLATKPPGTTVTVTVERGSAASEQATVVLAAKPDAPQSSFLGVEPSDRVELNRNLGFTVQIDSGSVTGPSAGLAFTLAVLDDLTPGELTGGAKVAVTGTMDAGGRVGAVGGVAQKAVAVRKAGATAFIVPAALSDNELRQVRQNAGDRVRVIPVADVDEALSALATLGGQVGAVQEYASGHLG